MKKQGNTISQIKHYSFVKANEEDMGDVLSFIKMLAAYEKAPNEVIVTEDQLIKDGFGEQPRFEVYLAKDTNNSNKTAGLCFFSYKYSTWKGLSLYLEDLFILEEARRQGLAQEFIRLLCLKAKEMNCQRFEWQVLDWNKPAIDFYKNIGAEFDGEWLNVRMSPNKIDEFLTSN
jgi:RimJ/RimL family protein N-acetyltransferase